MDNGAKGGDSSSASASGLTLSKADDIAMRACMAREKNFLSPVHLELPDPAGASSSQVRKR